MKQSLPSADTHMPAAYVLVLKWLLPATLFEPVCGDCEELFNDYQTRFGRFPAHMRMWRHCFSIAWHYMSATQRGVIMFIMSVLVVLAIVTGTFWLAGSVSMYIDVPSILIVAIPTLLVAFMKRNASLTQGLRMLMDSNALTTYPDTPPYNEMFSSMGKMAMLMGWFGFISGIIAVGSNVDKATFFDYIGPATGVCLLTLLYGIIVKVLCTLASQRLTPAK